MSDLWWAALPAVLVSCAVLLIPGLVVTAPLRLAFMVRLALSAAVSVACIGIAGVVFAVVGLPFAAWQVLVVAALLAVASWWGRARVPPVHPVRPERLGWWWLAGSLAASGLLIAVVAFWGVGSPEQFSQTYDNLFHLNAVSRILADGDASSLTLRTLIEPARTWAPYPAAWHSLVALTAQLSGSSVAVASNAAWIAVCTVVWLPGVAWLAQVVARRFDAGLVALVALPLGAAFGAMPYALLSWGTLYPTFFATALLPTALAVPVAVWSSRRPAPPRGLIAGLAGTAVVLLAIIFAQPRVAATWAVMILPFAAVVAVRAYRSAWRAGGRSRTRAVRSLILSAVGVLALAGAGFAYVVVRLGLFERPLDDRLGGPQARATQSVTAGIAQVIGQAWPAGSSGEVAFPAIPLALFVVAGMVAVWRGRRFRWTLVSYGLLAALFVLAAGSDDVVTKLLTALWYKDRYRLSSAIPVLGVAFATLGILASARWIARRSRRRPRVTAVALAGFTSLVAASTLILSGASSSIAMVFGMPADNARDELVSLRQIDFLHTVATIVPHDQRLLGDPWDGSALSSLFGGIEPVFPHVNGQWDPPRLVLSQRLDEIGTAPDVCGALDALRVRYVSYNPHQFGGGDPIGNQFFAIHKAVEAGRFVPVMTDGESTLYRIDQCGPLPSG